MKITLRRVAGASVGAGNARHSWPQRQAVIVRLEEEQGIWGMGEAAPLPSYSPDSTDDAQRALGALNAAHVEAALDGDDVLRAIERVAALVPSTQPAARFAIECAAIDLIGRRQAVPAPVLLGARGDAQRPLACLIGAAGEPGLIDAALRAVDAGYRCCKIKVGAPGAAACEIDALAALRARVGPGIALRIDANRLLSPSLASHYCSALASLSIELFEEPCAAADSEMPSPIPLALDESMQGVSAEALAPIAAQRGARVVVLKPMALGGLSHCLALARAARAHGAEVIVSHLFDGALAWRASAALALALDTRVAQGLAPHPGLRGWAPEATTVNRGVLRAWQAPGLGVESEWPQ